MLHLALATSALLSLTPDMTTAGSPSAHAFAPTVTVGVRGGTLEGSGQLPIMIPLDTRVHRERRDWFADGKSVAADVGYRFARAWTILGALEYGQMTGDHYGPITVTNIAPSIAVRLTTNTARPLGFIAEGGVGYRFLRMAQAAGGSSIASGFEPFRLGLGLTVLVAERLRLNAMVSVGFTTFTRYDAADGCVNDAPNRCDDLTGGNVRLHAFRSLTIGGTFDL